MSKPPVHPKGNIFSIQLDKDIQESLAIQASEGERSLNWWINNILGSHLKVNDPNFRKDKKVKK